MNKKVSDKLKAAGFEVGSDYFGQRLSDHVVLRFRGCSGILATAMRLGEDPVKAAAQIARGVFVQQQVLRLLEQADERAERTGGFIVIDIDVRDWELTSSSHPSS